MSTTANKNSKKKKPAVPERVVRLSVEDSDYLMEIVPYLKSEDEEVRSSALSAIKDLLFKEHETIVVSAPPKTRSSFLKNWQVAVGNRIKDLREAKGLTQFALGDMTGLPQSHISRIERGVHCTSSVTIEKIANALEVDAKEIDPLLED